MKLPKKSQTGYIYIIIAFTMLALMAIFISIFIYEIGKDTILDNVLNATIAAEQSLNVSVAMQNHATALKAEYDGIAIPYDLYFLMMWIAGIVTSITLAVKSRGQSMLSFSGSLFIGVMGLLLIVFFIDQVQVWFFQNIFNPVFIDVTLDLPIFDYYFNNLGWISAVWFVILLFINQVEFDAISFKGGRLEE